MTNAREQSAGASGSAQPSLRRYAFLSIATAIVTIALKIVAFKLTNSVGLLSDAVESLVNLVAAVVSLWALTVAAMPPDEEHAYGHTKAEYFSSTIEAVLILAAAVSIIWAAAGRLVHPQPLEQVGIGLGVSTLASAANGATAWILLRAGAQHRSIALRADAHHLLTDVWTSAGVIAAVLLVGVTGWLRLDPIIAILVALNIMAVAVRLIWQSGHGLLDTALPAGEMDQVKAIQQAYEKQQGVEFHAVRSRVSGRRQFVEMHVLVPGDWTVQRGHDLLERIEDEIRAALPGTTVFTHLEPIEDPLAFQDQHLDRSQSA
jgi:cation diffusion facilitator family transporter